MAFMLTVTALCFGAIAAWLLAYGEPEDAVPDARPDNPAEVEARDEARAPVRIAKPDHHG